ncbi:MFS transporter [Micromonospora polyrhachis]|uniref:MFS family permease n=1 Tax=Micromonospora polyrhachis TaxID=1282883 RepID=A0A7W7WRL5_9ACTN|nr:MFS transporter [Micromonospora polyrhachis]MBB4961220.1 MFS family permease [Micromonospora polyrhachis]
MFAPGYPASTRPPMVRPLWSLPGPALGALLGAALLTAPIGPLGSAIQHDLGLTAAATAATMIAPYAVASAALIVPGYLLGRRWPTAVVVPALLFLLLGSVVNAFAPGAAVMAVARVVGGLGAGAVLGVVLGLSGQLGRMRSQARLVLGITLGAALLLGPVVTGILTQILAWRYALLIPALLVVAIALAVTVVTGIVMLVQRGSQPSPPAAPATTTPLPSEPQSPLADSAGR